jgi:hypothetical protein
MSLGASPEGLGGGESQRLLGEETAVEVLERFGDTEARELLRPVAAGVAGAWLTEEARATLGCVEQAWRPAR